METKEFLFKGFKMNGFAMLFLHLVVFTAVIVASFVVGGTMLYVAGGVLTLVWFILLAPGHVQGDGLLLGQPLLRQEKALPPRPQPRRGAY